MAWQSSLFACCLLGSGLKSCPGTGKKRQSAWGRVADPEAPGVRSRQLQPLLLPQILHQHWLGMTLTERIPPVCGPWGEKCHSCPVPGVVAMGHEALVGLPFPEVADGRMC